MIGATQHLATEVRQRSVHITTRQVWSQYIGQFSPRKAWSPAINYYRLGRRIDLCVDLAGVDPDGVDLRVERGVLHLSGTRSAPDPRSPEDSEMRIVSMEIDHGPFSRSIELPANVDLERARVEYRDGLLWIQLPLRLPA